MELCLPSKKHILKRVKDVVKKLKAKSVFVATDNDAMIPDLTKALKKLGVGVAPTTDNSAMRKTFLDEVSDFLIWYNSEVEDIFSNLKYCISHDQMVALFFRVCVFLSST